MMRRSADVTSFREIDLPAYSDHFWEYVERIETRLGKRIKWHNVADDRSREGRGTHVDIGFCKQKYPAVWVDRAQLKGEKSEQALLAHEVTHIELHMIEGYASVGCYKECVSELQQKMICFVHIMLEDLVVNTRLKEFGFDRSEDLEENLRVAFSPGTECLVPPWPREGPREFRYALYFAGTYLNPWCKSHHRNRLRQVYRRRYAEALEHADKMMDIVKSTRNVQKREGQWCALTKILAMFDLDRGVFPHDP